jgi:8-oxo-dGTP diphosphatase
METAGMKAQLIEILGREPIVNYGFLKYLDKYELKRSATLGSSCAAVFGMGDERWGALYSRQEEEARDLSLLFDGITKIAIEPAFAWSEQAALGGRENKGLLYASMLYLPDDAIVPAPSTESVPIGVEHAETVYKNYKRAESVDFGYIEERLSEGPAVGVFRDGMLVGWAMTHDDMSMGMLTVLPDYRRQGIALDITLAMIHRMRQMGEIPIVHISKDNTMSLPLVKSLGFVEACDVIFLD